MNRLPRRGWARLIFGRHSHRRRFDRGRQGGHKTASKDQAIAAQASGQTMALARGLGTGIRQTGLEIGSQRPWTDRTAHPPDLRPFFRRRVRQTPKGQQYVLLIVALLPLSGLFLVGQSLLIRLREAKFCGVWLTFSSLPGVLGGHFSGRVESAFLLPAGSPVSLVLSCVRSYVSDSGSHRSRWENVLWQSKPTVAPYVGGSGSYLPVDFTIPYEARPTDGSNPNDEIFWRLTAKAILPGLDFRAIFRVPVFKTEASDPAIIAETIDPAETARVAGSEPANAKIVAGASAEGGARFHLGAARNKGVAASVTTFGIICLGSGLFLGITFSHSFTWFVGAIPLALSGLVGVGLLAFAVWLWFGTTTIDAV